MASYVPGLVIQYNDEQYVCEDGVVGHIVSVPCPDAQLSTIVGDYWAKPITDAGLFSGFKFTPGGASQTVGPSAQSFQVTLIKSTITEEFWYVTGTSTQFRASCGACCGITPPALPTTYPHFAPCQPICDTNSGGVNYYAVFSLPTLAAGFGYFPTVYFNEVLLTVSPAAAGYSSVTSLLAYLNSVASSVGTWAVSSDNLTLTVTQAPGLGTDVVCVMVIGVNASGLSPF